MTQYERAAAEAPDKIDLYAVLELQPEASADDILLAYQRQRGLYDPAHAEALGEDFVAIAEDRRAIIERAFTILHDPSSRFAYDQERGLVGDEAADRKGISNREVTFAVAGILAGLVLLAALWGIFGRSPTIGPAVTEVNYPATPIDLRTVGGGRFNLAEHRGKVVLINFWRTDCEPCKEETPDLQAAHQRLAAEGLVIVGVDLFDGELAQGKDEQDVAQFANRYGVEYPIALDETGQIARDYRLYPIPVSYFIDRAGNVRYIRIGQLTTADVEELFRRL